MRLRVLAVGQKMPGWVEQGVAEYRKRLPRDMALEIIEIAPGNRRGSDHPARAVAHEGERMLSRLGRDDHVVALDVAGRQWSTERLAGRLDEWRHGGRDVALLVGGPDGLDERCLAKAAERWSLSALTLPHPLVRIVLAEQLYRAWTLLVGHPYHR
ncbi:23S rRNA (pseudouridine1915-N3)-methyltransferase [Kushneria sinocarnis]|uniref:Ribosomal RNA large subunit methyltransferase H n=1 Tax=Kushneria sinocarnis TaxID=595502 RepID=A0A420WZ16_9GAMM|nr:23S rRNA (pseudouridine(1915)-N(3))-methyltransferase RlmH [Kushneria sinocarnis]RKR06410.1 23S rRNA (pseudouridine1915-N3)-methyltransferase [Kushneria sinocarnis]